jgi:hypothetical protein
MKTPILQFTAIGCSANHKQLAKERFIETKALTYENM